MVAMSVVVRRDGGSISSESNDRLLPPDQDPLSNVRVVYLRKEADNGLVEEALPGRIRFEVGRAGNDLASNVVICGEGVPIEDGTRSYYQIVGARRRNQGDKEVRL